MSTTTLNAEVARAEQGVRDVLLALKKAWSVRDAAGVCRIYRKIGEEFLLFDLYQPFEDVGERRAIEKTENFLGLTEGPVFVEYRDARFFSSVDLVVVRSACQFNFTMKGAPRQTEIRCRSTMVFKLLDGEWTCVHQHDSLPNKDVDI